VLDTITVDVKRYRAADADDWDALVRRARAPHFLLLRGYMDYHADRFVDHSLVVREKGFARALLPATRVGDTVVSHGGLTFGGLVTDGKASVARVIAWFDEIVAALKADGVTLLRYKPVPHIYHAVPAEDDLFALFRLGARLTSRSPSTSIRQEQRLPYSKRRKAAVKRSHRLTVVRDLDLRGFWPVVEARLLARHGVPPVHSASEIGLLAERFPDQIKLFTARNEDGATLAGVVVFETEQVAHAQYIATTDVGAESDALEAVFDHLLRDVYASKPWFDFGTSTERDGTLNFGLARNKESYGGRATMYDCYELALDEVEQQNASQLSRTAPITAATASSPSCG
jgi:hypothetical protein